MRRWFALGVALSVGTLVTGCPEYYGKEGYFDDAMRKDIKEQRQQRLEEEKTPPGLSRWQASEGEM
jgi:hypothetical protein